MLNFNNVFVLVKINNNIELLNNSLYLNIHDAKLNIIDNYEIITLNNYINNTIDFQYVKGKSEGYFSNIGIF